MKRVLKLSFNEFEYASRNIRELSVCRELGAEIVVLTKGQANSTEKKKYIDGFCVYQFSFDANKKGVKLIVSKVVALLNLSKQIKQLEPDVISAQNLKGLMAANFTYLFTRKKNKPLFVYDEHEFEIGLNQTRKKWFQLVGPFIEKRLLKKAAFTITVNEGIKNELISRYGKHNKIYSIRSIPEYCELNYDEVSAIRKEYRDYFKIDDSKVILCYHGNIQANRGLEEIIDVMEKDTSLYAVWIGRYRDSTSGNKYKETIEKKIKEAGISERIRLLGFMPHGELETHISAADIAIVMFDTDYKNYQYALPNKFFESIQAEIPIISSDAQEMKRLIQQYHVGKVVISGDSEGLLKEIIYLKNNAEEYQSIRRNCRKAKEELCWEHEKEILVKAYSEILT